MQKFKPHRPKVKICCISNTEEAGLAIKYGSNILGLVGDMPSGPGIISDNEILKISRFTPPGIDTFLLTQETTTDGILKHVNRTHTKSIQLVDAVPTSVYSELRMRLPYVNLIQVIHVLDQKSVEEAIAIAPLVDALLLDSGNPNLDIKQLGGTGRTHNWELSKTIVDGVETPVFLAGGLSPHNIVSAYEQVNPYGFDLCSGVRTYGKLDEKKLNAFFTALNGAITHTV